MKISVALSLIIGLTFSFQAFGKSIAREGIFVLDADRIDFAKIKQHKELIIDLPDRDGYEVYGPKGLSEWAQDSGINFIPIETGTTLAVKWGYDSYYDQYPTFEDDQAVLQQLAEKYPQIVKLFSIGKTIEGRDLWVVKLSDNPQVDEKEPEFKYIANMHGNEVTGRVFMVELLKDMAEAYVNGEDHIVELINNTEIFIMPTMNPDGYANRRRGNANWVDLNRDFPDFINDPNNTTAGRAVETRSVMEFQASRNFALSANLHDGATVVNYPWDCAYERHPFDGLLQDISKEYASISDNPVSSGYWKDGITNGYDWYSIHGGMQDWSSFWHGDLQVTLEISNSKWPSLSVTEELYTYNKPALIAYMKRVHQGAGFVFNNKSDVEGEVAIYKINKFSRKKIGDFPFERSEFYKVLEEGDYEFEVTTNNETRTLSVSVDSEVAPNGNYEEII